MSGKTIFVVDDNSMNLSIAEKALEEQYRVITLSAAEKMFAILGKVTPDLILLDIEMPEINGFEALKRLKTGNAYSGIPVVFMTATVDSAIEAKARELGAAGILQKPFSISALRDFIGKHIVAD